VCVRNPKGAGWLAGKMSEGRIAMKSVSNHTHAMLVNALSSKKCQCADDSAPL
jgi:hypothetical protein